MGVKSLVSHFDPLRKIYERVSLKKLAKKGSELKKESDLKVKEFKKECDLQAKKDEKEEKIKVEEEEKPNDALETNSVFGSNWKFSRLAVCR